MAALPKEKKSAIAAVLPSVMTKAMREDRRLRVLQSLLIAPASVANESVLRGVLMEIGHAVSADLMRTELSWLDEQGLVDVVENGDLYVVRITVRGRDVARGLAKQPGVAIDEI